VRTQDGIVAVAERGGSWNAIDDLFAEAPRETGARYQPEEVEFLAPVVPTVILGMAHNGSHADRAAPPQAFHKSARSLAGPGDAIPFDEGAGRTVVEAEVGIVIGRRARHLTKENALDAVLGYTVCNDVSAADQSPLDSFWTQTKNGKNYSPIGPWIVTDLDASSLPIELRVNGERIATASTADLARGIREVLVYLTRWLELGPGDIVMTGCPGTMASVVPGDRVEAEVGGIGVLANTIS
jgi:2-keto-4-pentenoate hydratase/2-oxohepta-3-ene-1,7-dioic acid hydratase in catechol pathway